MENLAGNDSSGRFCACDPDAASAQGGVAQANVTFGWGLGAVPGGATGGQAADDCCRCDCEGCGCC